MALSKHRDQIYYAKMCRIVIDIGGDIMRAALAHQISSSNIVSMVMANAQLKGRLSSNQLSIIHKIPSRKNYSQCDITLLYSLLRNLTCHAICPTNGWGRMVSANAILLGDDLERIRNIRNEIYGHIASANISKLSYDKYVKEFRHICRRMDSNHKNLLPSVSYTFEHKLNNIDQSSMDPKTQQKYRKAFQRLSQTERQNQERIEDLERRTHFLWKSPPRNCNGLGNQECESEEWRNKYYLEQHVNFSGRGWLLSKMKQRLEESRNGIILVAESGFEKSAFIANIIKGTLQKENFTERIIGYHICKHSYSQEKELHYFLLQLIKVLTCKIPEFSNYISKYAQKCSLEDSCTQNPSRCVEGCIITPLQNISRKLNSSLYILIDALDECQSSGYEKMQGKPSIVSVLRQYYREIPPKLKIAATSRNESELLAMFPRLNILSVSAYSEENQRDLENFTAVHSGCKKRMAAELAKLANSNMLILKYILSQKVKNCRDYLKLNLPNTISEMYLDTFIRIYETKYELFSRDRTLLETIISVQLETTRITKQLLQRVLRFANPPWHEYEVLATINRLSPHVFRIEYDGSIDFFHSSIVDWFKSNSNEGFRYSLFVQNGHKIWASYFQKEITTSKYADNTTQYMDIIAFAIHANLTEDKSFLYEMKSKGTDFLRSYDCNSEFVGQRSCNWVLERAAKEIDNYELLSTLLFLSDMRELDSVAFFAILGRNALSLKAVLDKGVTFSVLLPMFTGKPADSGTDGYCASEVTSPSDWMNVPETKSITYSKSACEILRATPHDSLDSDNETVLLASISTNFEKGVELILNNNSSTVFDRSTKGMNALDTIIATQNIKMLRWFKKFEFYKFQGYHLYLSSTLGHDINLIRLYNTGIRDQSFSDHCKLKEVNRTHISISTPIGTVQFDKNNPYKTYSSPEIQQALTCESALMASVKHGSRMAVITHLRYTSDFVKSKDLYGMSPLAASIYHRQEDIIDILWRISDKYFIVSPVKEYKLRANMLHKLFPFRSMYFYPRTFTIHGATLLHMVALKPSCTAVRLLLKELQSSDKLYETLDMPDSRGFSPLYYSLCHALADNKYETLGSYLHPRSFRMALVLILLSRSRYVKERILYRFGICGDSVHLKTLYFFHQPICKVDFPKLSYLHIQFSIDHLSNSRPVFIYKVQNEENKNLFLVYFSTLDGLPAIRAAESIGVIPSLYKLN